MGITYSIFFLFFLFFFHFGIDSVGESDIAYAFSRAGVLGS